VEFQVSLHHAAVGCSQIAGNINIEKNIYERDLIVKQGGSSPIYAWEKLESFKKHETHPVVQLVSVFTPLTLV